MQPLAELSKSLEGAENRNNGLVRAASAWEANKGFTALATSSDTMPEAVIASLMNALSKDAVICVDPGTPCPYFLHTTDGQWLAGIYNKSRTWRTWLFSGSGYWCAGWPAQCNCAVSYG